MFQSKCGLPGFPAYSKTLEVWKPIRGMLASPAFRRRNSLSEVTTIDESLIDHNFPLKAFPRKQINRN
jgi:hypothetical protein